ncbi:NADH:ubiquinone reductase (Na(+)-transporting) subunit E [Sedimentibacter hydroxybenzoicus DSM 7310]|uniref:NADH:ubiquinone reductase (Na(+)-transporting) subunit E n=1 Tax=Sedimentibacter hydroxybenzoicus DSM 7310 TaxID=1123245 RepID=A0A974GVF5_SEDHY|nr:Rnf-Nqr domain containing protein [Sedimentibacter hydroxybenzoicus]NYB73327.1 NADH:ubiquinone reductase (Na(+)-transporting) subunit E [Sedimentibacter hydroxybenzoicus DSM 7310]
MIEVNPIIIIFAAIFTSNMIFSNFLGMCSFIAVSKEIPTAIGLGISVTMVMTVTTILNYIIYWTVLVRFNLEYLMFIIFILIIAAFVQLLEMVLERYLPTLYYSLGIFLPLITVNCAILGISLFMVTRQYNFMQTLGYAVGSGIGWLLAITAMAGIRSRLNEKSIPEGLRGTPITLIITGIMALAFVGFSGMVQIQ